MKKSVLVVLMLLTGIICLFQFTLVADESAKDSSPKGNQFERKIDAVFGEGTSIPQQRNIVSRGESTDFEAADDLLTDLRPTKLGFQFANALPKETAESTNQSKTATREAVIDIAYVFKQSDTFRRQTEEIKAQAQSADKKLKQIAQRAQTIGQQIKQAKPGSELYTKLEVAMAKARGEIETHRAVNTSQLLRIESKLYLATFNRIRSIISGYAKENGIRVVRRQESTRELDERIKNGDRQAIMQLMTRRVLYVDDSVLDITDEVVKRMKAAEKQCEVDLSAKTEDVIQR